MLYKEFQGTKMNSQSTLLTFQLALESPVGLIFEWMQVLGSSETFKGKVLLAYHNGNKMARCKLCKTSIKERQRKKHTSG